MMTEREDGFFHYKTCYKVFEHVKLFRHTTQTAVFNTRVGKSSICHNNEEQMQIRAFQW
jgi:hypothetical protein